MSSNHKRRIYVYIFSFLCVGSLLALPGASLTAMARNVRQREDKLWPIFMARGIAYSISSIMGGFLGDKIGLYDRGAHVLMAISMVLAAIGIFFAWYAHTIALLAFCTCLASVAMGVLDTIGNVSTLRSCENAAESSSTSGDLSAVHAAFGFGCLLAPTLIAYLGHQLVFFLIALAAFFSGLLLFLTPGVRLDSIVCQQNNSTLPKEENIYNKCTAKVIALFFFFCMWGAEQGAGGLITSVAQISLRFSHYTSLVSVSVFWMAIFLARLLVAVFPPPANATIKNGLITDYLYLLGCILLSGIFAICITRAFSAIYFIICVFFLGFGFGPIFPIAFARLEVRLGKFSTSYGGILIASGGFGEMMIPAALFRAWRSFHRRGGEIGFGLALAAIIFLDALAWLCIIHLTPTNGQQLQGKFLSEIYEPIPIAEIELPLKNLTSDDNRNIKENENLI